MPKPKILITGSGGQIGTELTIALNERFGKDQVIVSDIHTLDIDQTSYVLDICDNEQLCKIIEKENITEIYHLAAVLSAKGESIPLKAWEINMRGYLNILEAAKNYKIEKVFYPSSIAVFGNSTPKENTPQHTIHQPNTVYGISKYAGELWSQYYFEKYNLDVRGIRFPGVISYKTMPGGGTTDYAVAIFHEAIKHQKYDCYLQPHTPLPMIYMPDTIEGVMKLMYAPSEKIKVRTAYNIHGFTIQPDTLYKAILKYIPDFEITYVKDPRQAIADSWNHSIDDAHARKDWGFTTQYSIDDMVKDMIHHITLLQKK